MKKVTVSAPGKLMLLGEHAVVYGRPCIVTAVGQRMFCKAELVMGRESGVLHIDSPHVKVANYKKPLSELGKGEIPKDAQFVEIAVKNFIDFVKVQPCYKVEPLQRGVKITTKSEFSSQIGFGSSSAATVCTIKALSELFGKKLSNKQLFDLSYKTVLDIQGKGSGFDVAAAIYGGTLYFVTGGKVIKQIIPPLDSTPSPRPIRLSSRPKPSPSGRGIKGEGSLPLVVGYSGVKADTVTLINQVVDKASRYPKVVENIYKQIADIVELARKALVKEDWVALGELMNFNQGYLEALGVSIDKLSAMIYASRSEGAYGAKLSGAGGGDCMIALVEKSKQQAVKSAIESAGGEVIEVETNVEGVRVEK